MRASPACVAKTISAGVFMVLKPEYMNILTRLINPLITRIEMFNWDTVSLFPL